LIGERGSTINIREHILSLRAFNCKDIRYIPILLSTTLLVAPKIQNDVGR